MIKFFVPGKPIAKARPRFFVKGRHVGAYNKQQTEESRFLFEASDHFRKETVIDGPVCLAIRFCMPRPTSHMGSGKNASRLKPSAPTMHVSKPDLDNLVKFVKDCLNGVAWRDDSQVVKIEASKVYADHEPAGTEVKIECLY